nr:Major outer membrane porin [Chlamydiota bacterium]
IKSDTDFSWSVGGRLTLLECNCFGLGIEGQYFCTNPDIIYVHGDANFLVYPRDVSMKYQEWQGGIAAYYRLDIDCHALSSVVPYIGIKRSGAFLDMDDAILFHPTRDRPIHFLTLVNCVSAKKYGLAIGLTATICSRFALSAEGRFGDEKALHLNGQIRF